MKEQKHCLSGIKPPYVHLISTELWMFWLAAIPAGKAGIRTSVGPVKSRRQDH